MPILGELSCFHGKQPSCIGSSLLQSIDRHFRTSANPTARNAFVLRLEAYLDVSAQPLDLPDRGSASWTEKWKGFAGALASERFSAIAAYPTFCSARQFLSGIGDTTSLAMDFPSMKRNVADEELQQLKQAFETLALVPDRVVFWNGWTAKNKIKQKINFRLHAVHDRLGSNFCTPLLGAAQVYLRGRSLQRLACVNELATYLVAYPKPLTSEMFQSPPFVEEVLTQFMLWYFRSGHANGSTLHHLSSSWSTFAQFLEGNVLGTIWAETSRALPRPDFKRHSSTQTHVRKKDGADVRCKLLTDVPISLTDASAIEFLWRDVRRDTELVTQWAEKEAEATWNRHLRRKEIAHLGEPCIIGGTGSNNGNQWKLSRENPAYLANAAATFENRGYVAERILQSPQQFYPTPLATTAMELGLPTPMTLLAYATLLVRRHPQLTPANLGTLELFDKHGHLVGIQESDAGSYLRGFKRRRGADLAEQRVLLDSKTKVLVENLIALTQPLRCYLKSIGDDSWRKLFLSTNSMGSIPRTRSIEEPSPIRGALALALREATGISAHEASNLANRFTLQRLRASCGVLIYFESQSVERMSEALGHARHNRRLLDRYLPRPLQNFFLERWIRIFQAGILCECLKDSPELLQQATGFSSTDEISTFLENHALKAVPGALNAGAEDRQSSPTHAITSEVVFFVSPAILECILRLKLEPIRNGNDLTGITRRWIEIADKLIPAIEADDILAPMLGEARDRIALTRRLR